MASPSVTTASASAPSSTAGASPAASPATVALADGRVYPGPYFLGKADALVTLDEYADFQ